MTYLAQEQSTEDGQPVELFLFEISGVQYPYTNSEDEITKNSIVYEPEAISRSKIENNASSSSGQVNITVPSSNMFARLFIGIPPGERSTIKISQFHRTDGAGELAIVFDGFVSQLGFTKKGKIAKIICRPITSKGQQQIPKRTFQGLCNFNLYDDRCGILESDFQEFGTIASASGRDLTITGVSNLGPSDDYWVAGYLELGKERRLITAQATGGVVTVGIEFKESVIGQSMRILPGCKLRRVLDCRDKFDNELRFGGFPYVPIKNIFTSSID